MPLMPVKNLEGTRQFSKSTTLQTVTRWVKWTFLPDTQLFQSSPLQLLSLPATFRLDSGNGHLVH